MAANVLNSPRAAQMSVFVVRAFSKMRALLGDKRDLARQLAALEKELKQRLDIHEAAIVTILQRIMDIIDPPIPPAAPAQPKIGGLSLERAPANSSNASSTPHSRRELSNRLLQQSAGEITVLTEVEA